MRVIDLFAGMGGMSLGLQNAGFTVVAAYDNWKPAIDVYRANFSHPIHETDLYNLDIQATAQLSPDFKLIGTKSNLEQMIGNAVPVKLAEFIANAILESIHHPQKQPIQLPIW